MLFLLVCLSQLYPPLRVGYWVGTLFPLVFVVTVTLTKEAIDDISRFKRDLEANSEIFEKLTPEGTERIKSSSIKVGDVIHLRKNQKIPADMIFLRTEETSGSVFLRTDQLDGETDWKLRIAATMTQKYANDEEMFEASPEVFAERPNREIYDFVGTLKGEREIEPLNLENTLWMNCVLASSSAIGCVIYTGRDTRAIMNQNVPKQKLGQIDRDITKLVVVLFLITIILSVTMVSFRGLHGTFVIYFFLYMILFSAIVPLTLRTNIDVARLVYNYMLTKDEKLPNVIMRNTTLPEELGRISYILSDKTGTLTKNDMEMKKLHLGTIAFDSDSISELTFNVKSFSARAEKEHKTVVPVRGKRDMAHRIYDTILALSLCHNVTPVVEDDGSTSYQASSPDEVAIVKWTEKIGLKLVSRSRTRMNIQTPQNTILEFEILYVFPFTSESKRMGIIVKDLERGEIVFYQKGADTIMANIVQSNDWLDEECGNFAREGLRTLVIGRKKLSDEKFATFEERFKKAGLTIQDRKAALAEIVKSELETELELLAVTGVEDKLQDDVKLSLETLRNAGIKIWMLTGDKVETATCIAISSKLVSRTQRIVHVEGLENVVEAERTLISLRGQFTIGLVIDGKSLQVMLDHFPIEFITLATKLPSVVCCRCSPTQKAEIAALVKKVTKKRVCCIGDGGNDVSMIQEGNLGVGIVGKEGLQASLAADFSITQFNQIVRLLLWHGRNCYRRTSKLTLFVFHRGIIISIMQAIFSAMFHFTPIALFGSTLIAGYSTVYTNFSVFSLVFDHDVPENVALMYPELYKELIKGRSLNFKVFFIWLLVSIYQGCTIMIMAFFLFEQDLIHIKSISFTSLILNELLMVALEIHTWHWTMLAGELASILFFIVSLNFIRFDIDVRFAMTLNFYFFVGIITVASFLPLFVLKWGKRFISPASYAKLTN